MQTSKKTYSVSEARLKQLIKKQLDLQIIEDGFYLDSKKMPQLRQNILLNIQMTLVVASEGQPSIYSIDSLEKLKNTIIGTVAGELIKI